MDLLSLLLEKKPREKNLKNTLSFPPSLTATWLAEGVLQLIPQEKKNDTLIISAGIHGNETVPVEILLQLLSQLAQGTLSLQHNLLLIFGNVPAMRENKRYIHNDLNRMFGGRYQNFPAGIESERAAELESVIQRFFQEPVVMASARGWHLDLHTAIRGSCHEQFALLPFQQREYAADLLQWLEGSDIDALVFHKSEGGTFSQFTSQYFNMDSCTMEIGKVYPFGQNELTKFRNITMALHDLIADSFSVKREKPTIKRYRVIDSIIKQDSSFQLHISEDTKNFTAMPDGFEIASQENQSWKIISPANFILFPNADVAIGLRAGLLLEQIT
ncbi:succinylglutamate desuccinylase [Xenorhabdus sp. Flor]|uniref:succinylglutamate desuccinylase n=1 Tax=Xenorhabdus cabanillasii TaxID=351673 RepID=UPI0019C9630E|nr:succinylglutamate desuccinylase [Xenorhabdus sp. Flor]MBD2814333.1 succinylglutamate desuccinylase [Xenorhabdus sp. Flor]